MDVASADHVVERPTDPRSVIGHAVGRLVIGPHAGAIGYPIFVFGFLSLGDFLILKIPQLFDQKGHRNLSRLTLGSFVAVSLDPGRQVQDSDRVVGLVHRLPALARTPGNCDFQVFFRDIHDFLFFLGVLPSVSSADHPARNRDVSVFLEILSLLAHS